MIELKDVKDLFDKFYDEKGDSKDLYNSMMTVEGKMIDFADYCIKYFEDSFEEKLKKEKSINQSSESHMGYIINGVVIHRV
jgi:hypothetical protein